MLAALGYALSILQKLHAELHYAMQVAADASVSFPNCPAQALESAR
jgi:hypothetical protein